MKLGGVPVQALIFDFDGVLADTEELHCAALQAVATSVGAPLSRTEYFAGFLGLPDRACLTVLCDRAGLTPDPPTLDRLVAEKRAQYARLSPGAAMYCGAADTIRWLHPHFLLAIASGAFRDEIEPVLRHAEVHSLFAAIVGAEDVRAGKPAPDPFLHALQEVNRRLGSSLSAADCVVIEDSPLGLMAARAAGMRCIGVTTHNDSAALMLADAVIEHVNELHPEALR
ncbi:MAG: HAD family phosphatase [Deltaproteobacteria bacterium]|nr:HAD family phosphatase [Deltaproteobacteria bacterium]